MAEPTGAPGAVAGALPGGVPLPAPLAGARSVAAAAAHSVPRLHPVHALVTDRQVRQVPELHDPEDVLHAGPRRERLGSNFVCSASSMGPDEAWTAGHCVSNNPGRQPGFNDGFSYNVLVCPVYDNGFHPAHGCWGGDQVLTLIAYRNGGNGNVDFGGDRHLGQRNRHPRQLGAHTGWLGFAWNQSRNQHWVAMGYPQGAPFAGGKIIMAASSVRLRRRLASGRRSLGVAMGSNLTGGSSGGPWIIYYGLPGQVAGGGKTSSTGTTTGSGTPSPRRWRRRTSTAVRWLIYNSSEVRPSPVAG